MVNVYIYIFFCYLGKRILVTTIGQYEIKMCRDKTRASNRMTNGSFPDVNKSHVATQDPPDHQDSLRLC